MKLIDSNEVFGDDLRDPEFVSMLLSDLLKDDDLPAFLTALKHIANANGGMTKIARDSAMNRVQLYKALSGTRNPRIETIVRMLNGLGLELAVSPKLRDDAVVPTM